MPRGRFNSSITRVRPTFQALIDRDPSGRTWLADLLSVAPHRERLPAAVLADPGHLDPDALRVRPYIDRILGEIPLAGCFEKPVPPPKAFLSWLITHPRQLQWPLSAKREPVRYGRTTQGYRERLIGKAGVEQQGKAIDAALDALGRVGPQGSLRKWWSFEGFTEVDCCLETDRLVLFVEGKRLEPLSPSTAWFPERSQLIRNLEVAAERAGQRAAAVLLVTETPIHDPLAEHTTLRASTPHLNDDERQDLANVYLGQVTWKALCDTVGVDFRSLPDEVSGPSARSARPDTSPGL